MVLLVKFPLEFVVDPLVLLGGGEEGQEAEGGEGSEEGQVGGPERPQERSKHIISVALSQSIYFKSNYQYYPILKGRKTSKYKYIKSFLLGLHQVVVHEQPLHYHPVVAPVRALTVHLVPAPLPVVEATVRPGVFPLSEPVSVYELAFIEIAVCEGVSAYPVLLPVSPLSIVDVSGLHSEGASALFLVSCPKTLVVIAVVISIFAFAFT